jgi:alpha-tubulin suppressor-like RCC1 family protein
MSTVREVPYLPGLEAEFEVVRELGRGGTAVVYLARERDLDRRVAIKVIHPALAVDEESVQRLVREARTLARLHHPNIITLYGTRRLEDGRLALIMQLADGDTLRARLRAVGKFDFEGARSVLRQIAGALAHAHRKRIVHRDIKPENIHLDGITGRAHLSDFGIARIWGHETGLTLGGSTVGTPTYMSPEQIDGGEVDGRSDLYSLGLIGWELLAGRRPWDGESLYGIIYKQKHEALPPLEELCPGTPESLRGAIELALAKSPRQRWPDAESFIRQLDRGDQAGGSGSVGTSRAAGGSRTAGADDPRGDATPAAPAPHPSPGPVPPDLPTIRFLRPDGPGEEAVAPATERGRGGSRWRAGLITLAVLVVGGTLGAAGLTMRRVPAADPESPSSLEVVEEVAALIPPEPAQASSAIPARLVILAGEHLRAPPLASLSNMAALRVEDDEGEPVAGVEVLLSVVEGGGSIQGATTETDSRGIIDLSWTLGSAEEVNVALASVAGSPSLQARLQAVSIRPELVPRPEVAPGGAHTCALSGSGRLSCWGANDRGQIGTGGGALVIPTPVAGPATVVQVTAGAFHTCALTGSGRALCWGGNERGQLGTGTYAARVVPTGVVGEIGFTRLAAGRAHTCGLSYHGAVYCWGANEVGQIGDGTEADRLEPTAVVGFERASSFRAIFAGGAHTCAVAADDVAYCWGDNRFGQLGEGTTTNRRTPVPVAGGLPVRSFAMGDAHSCGITAAGGTYCWGRNDAGQLGTGDLAGRRIPAPIALDLPLVQVSAGSAHTCGVTTAGRGYCWGRNQHGQLGDGTTTGRSYPIPVADSLEFATIQASGDHTCARTPAGERYCWGRNAEGQLGDGTRVDRSRPTPPVSGRSAGPPPA